MCFSDIFPNVYDEFGHWFAGFVDGEGSFEIMRRNYRCRFTLGLRDDDSATLEMICKTLGLGKVYYSNINTISKMDIGKREETRKLCLFFDKYPLRSKKQRDYAVWKQAVAEYAKPKQYRSEDLLEQCFHQIRQVRAYNSPSVVVNITVNNPQLTFAL